MKILLLICLTLNLSCAVKPAQELIKDQKAEILLVGEDYDKIYNIVKGKMLKCYNQKKGSYHLMGEGKAEEKTIFKLNQNSKSAVVYHQRKTEFVKNIIFYVQVQSRGPASTEIKLYGQGRGLRTKKELKENLEKWFEGKPAYCIGQGTF
tara:strand:+ start:234 stop:683 length:450 start_codon:yes stop_codon:yes gene_type:complete